MADLNFLNIHIAALSCAVPSHIQKIDVNPAKSNYKYLKSFIKQIGIKQRHISITEQTALDLGFAAAKAALKKANWKAEDLDLIVFDTQTQDFNPGASNSMLMQYRLGARTDVMAFDVTLGCSAFPYGLSIISSLLQQPKINKGLLITGDSRWCNYTGPDQIENHNNFLNGESTTAILFEKKENNEIDIELFTDGSGYKYLFSPSKGIRNAWRHFKKGKMPNGSIVSNNAEYMDGIEITSFATTTVVDSILNFLAKRGLSVNDFDGIVLHQANKQIITSITKRLKVDPKKVPISLDRYGNTDGATISTTIADAYAGLDRGPLKLLTAGFGIGLSWGVASFKIDPAVIVPIIDVEDERFKEGYVEVLE